LLEHGILQVAICGFHRCFAGFAARLGLAGDREAKSAKQQPRALSTDLATRGLQGVDPEREQISY